MDVNPFPCHWILQRIRVFLPTICLLVIVATCGCGGGPKRLPVEGTVTVDGQMLESGQFTLIPLEGTRGPTAGAEIVDGKFSIASNGGPLAGTFRVEIMAAQTVTGKKQSGINFSTGEVEVIEETRQLLPPRYNSNSELTAEVTLDGPNHFDFELQSH